MKEQTKNRIAVWWEAVEGLYTSNEMTESQYLTQGELMKSIIFNAENEGK